MQTVDFKPGDTIKLYTKDPGDQKVHATPFEGVVLAIRGIGQSKTFTIRKIATGGLAVERIFPIYSPSIEKIQVVKSGKVRRAKLFYLRKANHSR